MIKIIHLSDLHFAQKGLEFSHFLSKRWLGSLNLLLFRRHKHTHDHLKALLENLKALKVNYAIITGDLACTADFKEFGLALDFIDKLKSMGIEVFVVPGNHDKYTKKAYKEKVFYNFFEEPLSDFSLKNDKVSIINLNSKFYLVLLDTSIATSLASSRGLFSEELEKNLEKALETIPEDAHIIIANHFPLFNTNNPRISLGRAKYLQKCLTKRNIKLYLHGHSHEQKVEDLREKNLPILVDAGSITLKGIAPWNLISLTSENCSIECFRLSEFGQSDKNFSWERSHQLFCNW